jgi:hypothetical protein
MARVERSNTSAFDAMPAPVHTAGEHPAARQRSGSQ